MMPYKIWQRAVSGSTAAGTTGKHSGSAGFPFPNVVAYPVVALFRRHRATANSMESAEDQLGPPPSPAKAKAQPYRPSPVTRRGTQDKQDGGHDGPPRGWTRMQLPP